jgi:cation diffusion facilitator CzcD-associated flavoprotein CzcO
MDATVDKFDLRFHMFFEIECTGAEWSAEKGKWEVQFRDCKTDIHFVRYATILVTAVGGLSVPKDVDFEGKEVFKGEAFHTARWNHSYDYTGKRMAIIGNGCSAGLFNSPDSFLVVKLIWI